MFGRADVNVEVLSGSVWSVGGAPISKRIGGRGDPRWARGWAHVDGRAIRDRWARRTANDG
jgi:hypothetical protein